MIFARSCIATLGISVGGCFGSAPNIDDSGTGATTSSGTSATDPSMDGSVSATTTMPTSEASSADTTLATSDEATSDSTSDTGDPSCLDPRPADEFQCGNGIFEPGEICHAASVVKVATQGTDIAVVPAAGAPADLVVPNGQPGPALTYMQNDGTGAFTLVPINEVQSAFSVRAAQLDGGSVPDLVVGLPTGARVLVGQGGGVFILGDELANEGSATRVGFGLLDDGPAIDVVRFSVDIPEWFTHINDGGGVFSDGPGGPFTDLSMAFSGASDVVVGRFSEFDDVVAAIVSAGFVARIPLTGSGEPDVLPDQDGMGGDALSIAAGNIDDDGVPDLVSAHGDRLRVYLSADDYIAPYDIPVDSTGVVHVEVADIDRDGRGDLVTLARNPSRVVVMRDVTTKDPKPFEIPLDAVSSAARLVVAPLDDDCAPDIAVAHSLGEVTILLSEP